MSAKPPKTLSGEEKAALLILALDKQVATTLLSQLEDDELKRLTSAYARIEDRSHDALNKVFTEFSTAMQGPALLPQGADNYFKELLTAAVGEGRTKKLFADSEPKNRWDLLRQLDPKTVAAILQNEHPQAVTALLYQLEDEVAGPIIKELPRDMVTETVKRMGKLKTVSEEAIRDIEQVLSQTLGEPSRTAAAPSDGVEKAARMVNFLDTDLAAEIVDAVGSADEKLAEAIRKARFTMEDLLKADTKGLQQVLREISSDRLLLALRTASTALRDKLLACVSSRVADTIRDEIRTMGPTKLSDVEAAQKEVVEVALRLQKEGKLTIEGQGGEKMV